MAKTVPGPWVLITDVFVIIVVAIIIDNWCFFYTAIVLLGSSDQDGDIQGGMRRKRMECSDHDKAGELN